MCTQTNSSVELFMSLTQHFQFKYAKFHTFSQGAKRGQAEEQEPTINIFDQIQTNTVQRMRYYSRRITLF
jgi:flagellar basal body-associated protein FliL